MSREIKFRVWDNLNNRMFDVWKLDFILKRASIGYNETSEFLIEDYRILQYTGLKDKNDVEIYEGDIVKGKFFDTDYMGDILVTAPIVWNEQRAGFNIGMRYWTLSSVEIIGNIYENPELI